MRRNHDDAEYPKRRPSAEAQMEGLSLFAPTTEDDAGQLRARLVKLAQELALKAGSHGVTVGDVRITAENRGLMTGEESKERIAALGFGDLMKDAGLYPTGSYRRSAVGRSNRNLHQTWTTIEFAPVDARRKEA